MVWLCGTIRHQSTYAMMPIMQILYFYQTEQLGVFSSSCLSWIHILWVVAQQQHSLLTSIFSIAHFQLFKGPSWIFKLSALSIYKQTSHLKSSDVYISLYKIIDNQNTFQSSTKRNIDCKSVIYNALLKPADIFGSFLVFGLLMIHILAMPLAFHRLLLRKYFSCIIAQHA